MSHHNRPHHSRNQHNGQGNRQHGNRGAPPVHKPTITVSQVLADIEQFQNQYGLNADSMQDRTRESLNYKQEESALSNKFQEALGINQGQINGLGKRSSSLVVLLLKSSSKLLKSKATACRRNSSFHGRSKASRIRRIQNLRIHLSNSGTSWFRQIEQREHVDERDALQTVV